MSHDRRRGVNKEQMRRVYNAADGLTTDQIAVEVGWGVSRKWTDKALVALLKAGLVRRSGRQWAKKEVPPALVTPKIAAAIGYLSGGSASPVGAGQGGMT